MESICSLCRRIKIVKGISVLVPVKDIIDGNFIKKGDDDILKYVDCNGKKINVYNALAPDFIKSHDELCYIDYNSKEDLKDLFASSDENEFIKGYKEKNKKNINVLYYNSTEEDYFLTSFDMDDLTEYDRFLNICDELFMFEDEEEEENAITFLDDKLVITSTFAKKLNELISKDEFEVVKKIFESLEETLGPSFEMIEEENAALVQTQTAVNPKNYGSLDEAFKALNDLTGLKDIKNKIDELSKYLEFTNKVKDYTDLDNINLHMCFLGNPGTGKTTVARIIASILNKLGFVNNKFKEVSAKDLTAGYVGQTALKTNELIRSVKGGVLFIDEAYVLASDSNEYAYEALAEVLKEMEKNETVFLFSGYKKEMEDFIKMNSGLSSRVGFYFNFKDYTKEELSEIFVNKVKKAKLFLEDGTLDIVNKIIDEAVLNENFGNGRFIDKLFNSILVKHACNTASSNNINELKTITKNDINPEVLNEIIYKKGYQKSIGFLK